jgi:cellulose synthase/poly-beta-1,6-N-acetylglucosamine synthase-like glycosyltransferase
MLGPMEPGPEDPTETPPPSVDVLVSTYNEQAYVGRCLEALTGQDYPAERVTIWVLDGGSTDETVPLLREWERREPRVRVHADGRRRNLPESLNLLIERSTGELVAKVDAHGYPDRDFLSRAVAAFRDGGPSVACVGGRPLQEGETRFGRALALARGSRIGVGGSEYAGRETRSLVDTVQCGVYRREPLEAVGAFDAVMAYGEDEELNWRLRRAGYGILLDTSIRFHYIARPTWRGAFRQYRNYGRARAKVVAKHPDFLRAHHLAPAAALAGGGALAVAALAGRRGRRALGAGVVGYGVACLAGAAHTTARAKAPDLGPEVARAFTALHLGYGLGSLEGIGGLVRGWTGVAA